jgi:hypothetical protein
MPETSEGYPSNIDAAAPSNRRRTQELPDIIEFTTKKELGGKLEELGLVSTSLKEVGELEKRISTARQGKTRARRTRSLEKYLFMRWAKEEIAGLPGSAESEGESEYNLKASRDEFQKSFFSKTRKSAGELNEIAWRLMKGKAESLEEAEEKGAREYLLNSVKDKRTRELIGIGLERGWWTVDDFRINIYQKERQDDGTVKKILAVKNGGRLLTGKLAARRLSKLMRLKENDDQLRLSERERIQKTRAELLQRQKEQRPTREETRQTTNQTTEEIKEDSLLGRIRRMIGGAGDFLPKQVEAAAEKHPKTTAAVAGAIALGIAVDLNPQETARFLDHILTVIEHSPAPDYLFQLFPSLQYPPLLQKAAELAGGAHQLIGQLSHHQSWLQSSLLQAEPMAEQAWQQTKEWITGFPSYPELARHIQKAVEFALGSDQGRPPNLEDPQTQKQILALMRDVGRDVGRITLEVGKEATKQIADKKEVIMANLLPWIRQQSDKWEIVKNLINA